MSIPQESIQRGVQRQRSPSPTSTEATDGDSDKLAKKARLDLDSSNNIPEATSIVPSLRTAIDIKLAIDRVRSLKSIGHCPERVLVYEKLHNGSYRDSPEVSDIEDAMQELRTLYRTRVCTYVIDQIETPFKLCVTHPGCEYEDMISPEKDKDELDKLLQRWFDNAAVSGYGDVRAQKTKVDPKVRNAREIPAAEFSVEPTLLQQIQKCWSERFFPNSKVRVEPYKIHLYGPACHFKPHRDTPQKDLVGTFLLGLGDTTDYAHFHVADEWFLAKPGAWCAFYPDVPHCVEEIGRGYRAVIAFKIFRSEANNESSTTSTEVRSVVQNTLDNIQLPYGLLLERMYSIRTEEPNGFDAVLLACARARPDVEVHLLPVVTACLAEWNDDDGSDEGTYEAHVYPFTEAHIDYLLERDDKAKKESRRWLNAVKDVTFYSADFARSTITWKSQSQESIEYTGNESQPGRDDSIYLSYALLVLPATKRP